MEEQRQNIALYVYEIQSLFVEEDCFGGVKVRRMYTKYQNHVITLLMNEYRTRTTHLSASVEQVSENPVEKVFSLSRTSRIRTWRKDPSEAGASFEESQPVCCCGPPALTKGCS